MAAPTATSSAASRLAAATKPAIRYDYGPTPALFDKTWRLPDVEELR